MIYVFDTSSFSSLKFYHPTIFPSIWDNLNVLVKDGWIISTREVWNELQNGEPVVHVNDWLKERKFIFTIPNGPELNFVSGIFKISHFNQLIGNKQMLKGTPVADPFVIACAANNRGTVVTEEHFKDNAARIPNVCNRFKIPYINLQEFMSQQTWQF